MKRTSKEKPIMYKTFMFLASFVVVLTLVGSVATGKIVFRDDFEDGSATDGVPVTWSPSSSFPGSYEVIDGDYVLTHPTGNEEMYSGVNQYILADTSIRAQARLIGSGGLWLALFARLNVGDAFYGALLYNNGKLQIWRYGRGDSDSWVLASADVGIDPRAQDVLLRFDVIGNELSAWAWREGIPMPAEPQVTAVHSEVATGGVVVGADLGWRLSNNDAIFRYVEVYEAVLLSPDFNGDEIVDIEDLIILIEHWGLDEPSLDIAPPLFGDGIVDVQDLEVLMSYWQEEVLPVSLLAYWKLDETQGGIAYDSVGNYDGTLNGNPIWQPTSGMIDGALLFDGADDYFSTPFVLNPSNGSLSAFAWIKGGAPGQVIISQADGIGTGETWLGADTSDGTLMTGLVPPPVGRFIPQPLGSHAVITDGQWHHIGLVWDGSHRYLYVDGTEIAKDVAVQASLKSATGGLYIGAGKNLDASSFFSGLIDDVRIYNVALTAEEIAAFAE